MTSSTFFLGKLRHHSESANSGVRKLHYSLGEIALNPLLGKDIGLRFTGRIQCVHCGRSIKKTFGDGYCYPCFQKLAACDLCILKPELCHFRHGTCREPEWGKENCLIPHVVYIANTTGLKVGITREYKKFERWGDQGATAAIVVARVPERYVAGLSEVALKSHVSDKADWRALIRGQEKEVDLLVERSRLRDHFPLDLAGHLVEGAEFDEIYRFDYPVLRYPQKAITHALEKEPVLAGILNGVRGQYLFVGDKAINIRKYIGYEAEIII